MLPQSLQLSVWNRFALEAQQNCVRALYHFARADAYAVGEYQIELLGNPRFDYCSFFVCVGPTCLGGDSGEGQGRRDLLIEEKGNLVAVYNWNR